MTTITERVEYASAAAHDFAGEAIKQLYELLSLHERIGHEAAAKQFPMLLAALIEAAAKTYAIERHYEAAELIAEAIGNAESAIRESSLPEAVCDLADSIFRMKSVARDALEEAQRGGKAVAS